VSWDASTLAWIAVAVGFTVGSVVSLVEGQWISAVILALLALGVAWLLLSTRNALRRFDAMVKELPDPPAGPPSEAALAIESFYDAILDARGVPLTDQVRLDRQRVDGLLDQLGTGLRSAPAETRYLLDQLEGLIQRAKPIPLTDEIRLERDEVYDILDRMSASLEGDA
jgi:hypothetical protein